VYMALCSLWKVPPATYLDSLAPEFCDRLETIDPTLGTSVFIYTFLHDQLKSLRDIL
jgi:hypothetical protein